MSIPQPFKTGRLTFHPLVARDVEGARHEILNLIQSISNSTTIYFDGWDALGTAAVLRSIVQVLQSMKDPHPKLCFGRIICIDCSIWKSTRHMQRRIAEELKLDHNTMAMFDKEDEEDDFNGVDPTLRDAIPDVAAVIDRTLRDSSFLMIFFNGSDQEVLLSRLGVPEFHKCIIIWTFKRRFPIKGLIYSDPLSFERSAPSKLRYTNILLCGLGIWDDLDKLKGSEINAMIHEEAGTILTCHPCMQDDDRAMVIDCYLYWLFLHHSFREGASWFQAAHGANYWICDGIIQGDRTRDISKTLYQEVSFEHDSNSFLNSGWTKREMMLHQDSPYLVIDDDFDLVIDDDFDFDDDGGGEDPSRIKANMPCRWIAVTSTNKIAGDNLMKDMLARASSIIVALESVNDPHRLPNDLMEQCNNVRVLILSYCAFNFLSPLFHHCHTLRFLGLDHCINDYTSAQVLGIEDKWACLHNMCVLDLRYTKWDEILSNDNIDVMSNIVELNIEGSMCWQYTGQLEGRIPHLQRLRIIKPLRRSNTSVEIDSSFMGKTELEVLDLSGNKDVKKLPTSLSEATNLQVLVLDGCDGLENVVLSNSLLRSFSFDGYGPASDWTSMDELPRETSRPKCPPDAATNKDVKISLVSLEGCTQLKNLFLRGLPNLVELDLSGCAIKILDLETMVVHVPMLQRLFLLGCEHLHAIKWGPPKDENALDNEPRMTVDLELLCIDTRTDDGLPRRTRSSIVQQSDESFGLKVHAITADARLVRSLLPPIRHHRDIVSEYYMLEDVFFDIRITSSNIECDDKTSKDHHVVTASPYNDVSTEVGGSSFPHVQAFPQPPASRLDCHLEIGDGGCNVRNEVVNLSTSGNLRHLMAFFVESLHVHDTSTTIVMPSPMFLNSLKWCRVERCPRLDPVFPPEVDPYKLETIWASDLLMARCIWSKGQLRKGSKFGSLQHLHLRSCPSLRFALPVWTASFRMLETLHIVHCGSLRHVFAVDNDINSSIRFPKLTTIHLHDVSALQQICEVKMMIAPKLETIRTRGCWRLRRLPALGLEESERRKPAVEMEKDVWEALEWDGVDAGHHPSLYEAPRQSRYCKSWRLLRGTVLR